MASATQHHVSGECPDFELVITNKNMHLLTWAQVVVDRALLHVFCKHLMKEIKPPKVALDSGVNSSARSVDFWNHLQGPSNLHMLNI